MQKSSKYFYKHDDLVYYRFTLFSVLQVAANAKDWELTIAFRLRPNVASLKDEVFCRKCLRTLEALGLVESKRTFWLDWRITQTGREFYERFKEDKTSLSFARLTAKK